MPEPGEKDWLQPSLLDRLTDHEPTKKTEGADDRFLDIEKLRRAVRRDLGWLLNTTNFDSVEDLTNYPLTAASVLNYGMPELVGSTTSGTDTAALERRIRNVILAYEPRLIPESVRVSVVLSEDRMDHDALAFEIKADLWSLPVPLDVVWQTAVDLETGTVTVSG